MYFVDLLCPIPDITIPKIIYEVEPLNRNTLDIDVHRNLLVQQEDIIVKLNQLLVNIHNASCSSSDNITSNAFKYETNLNDVDQQNEIIRKLQIIEETVDKLASERGIDLRNISPIDLLEAEQNSIGKLVDHLDYQVEDCLKQNNINISTPRKAPMHICIHADVKNPPVSLFLMLEWFQNNGQRVFCQVSFNSKVSLKPSVEIDNYIKKLQFRGDYNYDLIINFVWQSNVISDCVLYSDIYNETPFIGEMISLFALCAFMSVDISNKYNVMQLLNKQFRHGSNVKSALSSIDKKLYKDINTKSFENVALGAFVTSLLWRSSNIDQFKAKLCDFWNNFKLNISA